METVQTIHAAFPDSIPFPALLAEFMEWTEHFERGQLGWFEFEYQRLDDHWIENGSALADQFALFIHLPDGSMIGFWKPDGHEGPPPVVLLGSEGDHEVLGATLDGFLWNWANGELGRAYDLMPEESDEEDEEQPEDARSAIADWLRENAVAPQQAAVPDLRTFFTDWLKRQPEQA